MIRRLMRSASTKSVHEDVTQAIKFWLRFPSTTADGDRIDHRVLIRQENLECSHFLDAVAVNIDGFEDALGQILLLRRGSFGTRKLRKMDNFSQPAFV